jgi:hypothetical protein
MRVQEPYFSAELKTYWASGNRELRPYCFVQPKTAQQVSAVLKIIGAANERYQGSCPFAVRSGG